MLEEDTTPLRRNAAVSRYVLSAVSVTLFADTDSPLAESSTNATSSLTCITVWSDASFRLIKLVEDPPPVHPS